MLFERIRRTQKPVFIFLAVMFAFGFALLGVGSSGNVNALDFLNFGGSSSSPISKLTGQVTKDPQDARAWIQLAQAYVTANQPQQAINAYASYIRLRPKDQSALTEASTLLEQQASLVSQNAQAYQAVASYYQNGGAASTLTGLPFSSSVTDPLASQQASPFEQQATALEGQAQTNVQQALAYRQSLAKLAPKNSFNQEALGIDAYQVRNFALAATALKAYLKLVPASNPTAKQVKAFLTSQVEPFISSSVSSPTP
jgi:tetratricopeptide (TPR) repeat protein